MNYSVYATVNDAVNAAKKQPKWEAIKAEHPDCDWQVNSMECEWNLITNGDSFYGGGTAKVVEKFMGEHSYEAQLTANIESQFETEEFYKKKFRFKTRQTSGNRVDIPRYLNGDMRYWFAIKKIKTVNKAIRVFAPMGGLSMISARQMQVCGALTCAVVEALETNGISVELWASCVCQDCLGIASDAPDEVVKQIRKDDDYEDICQLVKIKDSSQYCDYGMTNYITGNSGFYRNVIFKDRVLAGVNGINRGIVFRSCGASCNFERKLIPPDEDYDPKNDIIIPRIYDIDEAKNWLVESFNAAVTCGINEQSPEEGELE